MSWIWIQYDGLVSGESEGDRRLESDASDARKKWQRIDRCGSQSKRGNGSLG